MLEREVCMKKLLLSLFAAVFMVTLTFSVSFAAGNKMTGKILSIDKAKGEVVFCPSGTKDEIPMKADMATLEQKKIKAGNVVNIVLDEKDKTMIKKISKSATIPVG